MPRKRCISIAEEEEEEGEEGKSGAKGKRPIHVDKDPEASVQAVEARRLRSRAQALRLVSSHKHNTFRVLPPSDALRALSGSDVVKRGASRKHRFLFSLPGLLDPTLAGRLGTLSSLHTPNPVLHIDFPQGRLRLQGTVVHPRNRYLTFQCKPRTSVKVEDSFESMVVFSEAQWEEEDGRKEEDMKEEFKEGEEAELKEEGKEEFKEAEEEEFKEAEGAELKEEGEEEFKEAEEAELKEEGEEEFKEEEEEEEEFKEAEEAELKEEGKEEFKEAEEAELKEEGEEEFKEFKEEEEEEPKDLLEKARDDEKEEPKETQEEEDSSDKDPFGFAAAATRLRAAASFHGTH